MALLEMLRLPGGQVPRAAAPAVSFPIEGAMAPREVWGREEEGAQLGPGQSYLYGLTYTGVL